LLEIVFLAALVGSPRATADNPKKRQQPGSMTIRRKSSGHSNSLTRMFSGSSWWIIGLPCASGSIDDGTDPINLFAVLIETPQLLTYGRGWLESFQVVPKSEEFFHLREAHFEVDLNRLLETSRSKRIFYSVVRII